MHRESNPYFGTPSQYPRTPQQGHGVQQPTPQQRQEPEIQPQPSGIPHAQSPDQETPPQPLSFERPQMYRPPLLPTQPPKEQRSTEKSKRQDRPGRERHSQYGDSRETRPTQPTGKPLHSQPQPQPGEMTQTKRQSAQDRLTGRRHQGQAMPAYGRTKPIIWLLAWFCAAFWIVVILGGLIVLIVYLVFRPHSPSFEVSSVTLNAAYLDVDDLLNADLTVLAKFINPNKKVKVDFSYVVLELYYGNTMIASQYIEPFRAARLETRLANVHLVTSQVRLPLEEVERLKREIGKNEILFHVKGVFRARSSLGSFLRYSYRLYGNCYMVVTGPPTGVIKAVKCKTKR